MMGYQREPKRFSKRTSGVCRLRAGVNFAPRARIGNCECVGCVLASYQREPISKKI